MSNKQKSIEDLSGAKKLFTEKYESFKNTFNTVLNSIRFYDVSEEKKKSFLDHINKNMKIFFYPKSVEKKTMIFYINFGKNYFKLAKLMKIDGVVIFKEETTNNGFGNQLSMNHVEAMSPYLNYLLNFMYEQFQIINSDNIKKNDGPLIIFDKKIKTLMIEKKLCPAMGKSLDIIVKGLGTQDYVSFGIKNVDIEIVFKTATSTYIYKCEKQQFKKMFNKENYEKKKGMECKELLKWIEANKMDGKRTKYFIIPSQINVEKKDHGELPIVKKFISEFESANFSDDLESYLSKISTRVIAMNIKFSLIIRMKIDVDSCENINELDDLASEIGENESETFEEKEEEIVLLHKDFLKRFKTCIQEKNITTNTKYVKDLIIPSFDDISNEIKIEKPATPISDEEDDEKSDTEE